MTLSQREILDLVHACSWNLVQVGSNREVWEVCVCFWLVMVWPSLFLTHPWLMIQIERLCRRNSVGDVDTEIKLVPYKGSKMPGQFPLPMDY